MIACKCLFCKITMNSAQTLLVAYGDSLECASRAISETACIPFRCVCLMPRLFRRVSGERGRGCEIVSKLKTERRPGID